MDIFFLFSVSYGGSWIVEDVLRLKIERERCAMSMHGPLLIVIEKGTAIVGSLIVRIHANSL